MPTKIRILTAGGTISCREEAGIRTLGAFQIETDYPVETVFDAYSENFAFADYAVIARKIRTCAESALILTHGTDTLVYAAATLDYLLADTDKRVVLVSSRAPLDDPSENGRSNFRAAMLALPHLSPGVYVSYDNGDGAKLRKGSRLSLQPDFSDEAVGINSVAGRIENDRYVPSKRRFLVRGERREAVTDRVRLILCTPGALPVPEADVAAYILWAYHSGTFRADDVNAFVRRCRALGTDVYLTGVDSAAANYASQSALESESVLADITPVSALCKAAVAYAGCEPAVYMRTDVCGEFFHSARPIQEKIR